MAASNINTVVITGNLTRDPELRSLPSGTSVCKLRVAVNSRRKDGASGEWVDKPNYFDVTVWGAQGENCANYLSKGRPVAVEGRLDWREWEAQDGTKRQSIEIIANSVQFLGSRSDNTGGGNGFQPSSDVPADTSDFEGEKASAGGKSSPCSSPTWCDVSISQIGVRTSAYTITSRNRNAPAHSSAVPRRPIGIAPFTASSIAGVE